jgi:hypothetical protein
MSRHGNEKTLLTDRVKVKVEWMERYEIKCAE